MPRWDLIGGDPAPGDSGDVTQLANDFERTARRADDSADDLRSVVAGQLDAIWEGDGADACRAQVSEMPGDLGKLSGSYSIAAKALTAYAGELEDARRHALETLAVAEEADSRRLDLAGRLAAKGRSLRHASEAARKLLADLNRIRTQRATVATPEQQPALADAEAQVGARYKQALAHTNALQDEYRELETRRREAVDDTDAARTIAEEIRSLRESAARVAARKIDAASEAGIENRSFWQKTGDWFVETFTTLDGFDRFLDSFGDAVGIGALVLAGAALLAMPLTAGALIAGVAAVAGWTAFGLNAANTATTSVLAAQGKRKWGDVAFTAGETGLSVFGARAATATRAAISANANAGSAPGKSSGAISRLTSGVPETVRKNIGRAVTVVDAAEDAGRIPNPWAPPSKGRHACTSVAN